MRSRTALTVLLTAAVALLVACGGPSSPGANSAQSGTVQVTIGDAPGDAIVSFSVSIDSIVLTNTDGDIVPVLAEPTRVELTHLAGIMTPIATADIPQGTYTRVAITVSAPETTIVHPVSGDTIERVGQGSSIRTIQLSPPLELGGDAVNLNLDLSVADSVSVDSNGNVSFNPRIIVRHSRLNVASSALPRFEPIVGRVEAISGSTFAMSVRFGRGSIRVYTNDQTVFEGGLSSVSDLSPGMLVSVFARFGEDGKLLARKIVGVPPPAEFGLEGIIKNTLGSPVTQFTLIAHNGVGRLLPWLGGRMVHVTVGGSTVFRIEADDLNLGTLPFTASFDASSIGEAQAVRVHASSISLLPLQLIASHVTLKPQPVAGQVTDFNGGETFTLNLPADSALARLMGTASLAVFLQPGKTVLAGTVSDGSVTLADGGRVIVRGLLFLDGGQYKLVATHVLIPQ